MAFPKTMAGEGHLKRICKDAFRWLWWCAWASFGAVVAAAVCVAGVAIGDIDVHSAWQAWHLHAPAA